MMKKSAQIAGVLLMALGAGYVGSVAGRYVPDRPEAGESDVERLAPEAEAAFLAQVTESGGGPVFECRIGVIANHPDRIYCSDGGTAGFLLSAETAAGLPDASTVHVADGMAFFRRLP